MRRFGLNLSRRLVAGRFTPATSTPCIHSLRFFSSNSEDSTLEDRALQESFEGWWPRMLALQNLSDNEISMQMENLLRKKIVDPVKIFSAAKIFIDLQNPLLAKYKFDVVDFAEGVRKAYAATTHSLAKVVESMTVRDAPIDPVEVEASRSLLQEVHSDEMWKKVQKALKEAELMKETLQSVETGDNKFNIKIEFPTVILSKVVVQTVTVNSISTRVIERKSDDTEGASSAITKINSTTDEDLRRYKVGSVVATAEVFIEAEEEWVPSSSKSDAKTFTRPITEIWVFEGCISGQSPLQWIIKSMGSLKGTSWIFSLFGF